jgi:hypothetical protein
MFYLPLSQSVNLKDLPLKTPYLPKRSLSISNSKIERAVSGAPSIYKLILAILK